MRATPTEHIHIELVRLGEQQVRLVTDKREAFQETDADTAVGDDLCERQAGGLDVVPALDDLQVGCYRAEVLVCALVGEVTQTEGLAYLPGGEELFEL